MGSYSASSSYSSSSAVDKRLVASDNAIGFSTDQSGNGNTTSLGNTGLNGVNLNGSNLTTNNLDGGAIGSAFEFANRTLSSVLSLAITRDKEAAAAAVAVNDSANAAIQSVATKAVDSAASQMDEYKKWALYLGLGGVAFWLWSKK